MPIGYWPVILVGDVKGAAGIHLDVDGQPYALVEAGPSHPNWSLTTSHEVLEMLVDPFGKRLVAGPPPAQAQSHVVVGKLQRVQYLVEVCDPSEDEAFSYTVNDVVMSDFYTPSYFDPVASAGVRYSYSGVIPNPRQVLRGGYVSFSDPKTSRWFQVTWFDGPKPKVVDLGILDIKEGSIRASIDRITTEASIKAQTRATRATLAKAKGATRTQLRASASGALRRTVTATAGKANQWRRAISGFKRVGVGSLKEFRKN